MDIITAIRIIYVRIKGDQKRWPQQQLIDCSISLLETCCVYLECLNIPLISVVAYMLKLSLTSRWGLVQVSIRPYQLFITSLVIIATYMTFGGLLLLAGAVNLFILSIYLLTFIGHTASATGHT